MHSDGKNLPYTEAVIHEIHRHATISYISVNHAPMYDTTYSGYNFLRTDMITPCLYEVWDSIWNPYWWPDMSVCTLNYAVFPNFRFIATPRTFPIRTRSTRRGS